MPRRRDAPWVILGTGKSRGVHTKMGVIGKDKRTGMWTLAIYEYDEENDRYSGLYQQIMFANIDALRDLTALCEDGLKKWEETERADESI